MSYLIRLDDACPTMDRLKWGRVEQILDRFEIKPLVGVVPANDDPELKIDSADPNFWNNAKIWESKGWNIALHGYDHRYISKERGINPLWNRSEFAGIPLDIQKEKIQKGFAVLHSHNISPKFFFAPSHTFDDNTLIALREVSDIRIISDTIAIKPYRKGDFVYIPQMGGTCRRMPSFGIWTFCLHPNKMNENDFLSLEDFISKHADKFMSFSEIELSNVKHKSLVSRILSSLYFVRRRLHKT